MPKFQVQYKNNSKTVTNIYYSSSSTNIVNFFQDLINAEITEIREIVYENNHYPIDDGDYIKSASCFITLNQSTFKTFKIPKLRKKLSHEFIINNINSYVKIHNKKPKTIRITQNF